MKVVQIVLLALISLTLCQKSGVKVAITSDFFKILTKFDLNSILQGVTIIDHAETSGKYLFNYEVVCENLWFTNINSPENVVIDQETTSDGLPQVKVTLYNIQAAIEIEYLFVKYGLIKDTFHNPTGSVSFSYIEGRYHFTSEGKLVISEFNVEIDDFKVDVRSDFLNWLIDLFKGLIKSKVTDALKDLGGTISDQVNAWVDGDFSIDIGYGIQLNLTNTLKPQLTQLFKNQKINEYGLKVAKALFSKDILSETLTSVLTFGILGSCFPTGHPEVVPDITPAVDMEFTTSYLTNEVQILISTFTMNNALYIAQTSEILEYQFDNTSTIVFPWNFDTEGLQEILPQYGEKYPGQNYEVLLKVYASPAHSTPYIQMSETNGKLVANFNFDFSTNLGENVVEDLALNVAVELPFTIQVKYDLLTINWDTFSITNLAVEKNELNVPYDDLVAVVGKMLNTYVTKFIKGYTKNVALSAILTLVTGMEFKNFKLETKEGFLLASIAVNLD